MATTLEPKKPRRLRTSRNDHDRDGPNYSTSISDRKHILRNPTRYIPEAHGFCPLTKQEIKRDRREIVKRFSFMGLSEGTESDIDDIEAIPNLASQPLCIQDSIITCKRQRLISYYYQPQIMPIDLENLKMKLESARKDYQTIGIEEETWLQNFELSRDRVLSSLLHCQETNRQSIEETRSLFDFIITECAITDIKKPYTVMCEAIFAYDQRVQNCEASLYKLGMGLSASPMAPAHTNFAQDRSHLVETTETATNFSKTNALVPEPTSALPPAAEKSNQSEVPLRLTPDETNVASPAASTLMELYSMLEDEIADCEARLHDVQPFFQFTDGSQARHHPVKLATQADAGTAALQEGFDRLHWLPGPELRGCPLNTLLSEESLVLQCLDSHCKIEPGPRRKRKPGSVSSIAGAGLPSTTCSSHDIRLNTFAFTGVTPLYPQLVSAAVEHQSRNLGFKFGTGVNSVNNSTPGSNLTSLETMKRNDDEALQTFAILASILQLEAQTREAAISVAKWQQLAADATRMAAKVMSSLDSIFVDSDHDDDKPQLHRATGEVGGSTDDDNGRCSGQRVASQKSSPTPYRSRARSGSIDATSSLPLSLPSNQATASPGKPQAKGNARRANR